MYINGYNCIQQVVLLCLTDLNTIKVFFDPNNPIDNDELFANEKLEGELENLCNNYENNDTDVGGDTDFDNISDRGSNYDSE